MSGWPARGSLWIFARRYQEERCQNRLASASAWPCVTSRPSLVACQGAAAFPDAASAAPRSVHRGVHRELRRQVGPVEGLGDGPDRLGPEAQRLALVRGERIHAAGAGVERQDRDVLAELAQACDEAAARERNVVRVGGNEHMGHGWPSIAGRDRLPNGPVARARVDDRFAGVRRLSRSAQAAGPARQ